MFEAANLFGTSSEISQKSLDVSADETISNPSI